VLVAECDKATGHVAEILSPPPAAPPPAVKPPGRPSAAMRAAK
jgi:hypothetical protein